MKHYQNTYKPTLHDFCKWLRKVENREKTYSCIAHNSHRFMSYAFMLEHPQVNEFQLSLVRTLVWNFITQCCERVHRVEIWQKMWEPFVPWITKKMFPVAKVIGS